MTPRRIRNPTQPHERTPCRCHPRCLGHHYHAETLVCIHHGCSRSWYQEQERQTECEGEKIHPLRVPRMGEREATEGVRGLRESPRSDDHAE